MFLGEFTRPSWVRSLATAGVCHRCFGCTSGPRLPPRGTLCIPHFLDSPWSSTAFLGEFTRLSWVRALATAGVCHRCMGGTSGPRLPPWGFWCYSRRCVLLRDPSETWPPQNFTTLLVDRAPAISIKLGHFDRGWCPTAAWAPRRVLRSLPGLRVHQPGPRGRHRRAGLRLHVHPSPRHVRDPEHLQRALQLHTSF